MAEAIRARDKDTACRVARQKFQMFADQHLDLYEQ